MTAFRACLRYELLMQLRKRSLWPVPGAALNLLRPAVTPGVAWVSVAVLLTMAVLALSGARALLVRTTRIGETT